MPCCEGAAVRGEVNAWGSTSPEAGGSHLLSGSWFGDGNAITSTRSLIEQRDLQHLAIRSAKSDRVLMSRWASEPVCAAE
jgi:hypothetical protein